MGAFPWYSTVTGGRYGSFSLVLHSDLWELWELFLGTPSIKMTSIPTITPGMAARK
jgi:hypothetical protein